MTTLICPACHHALDVTTTTTDLEDVPTVPDGVLQAARELVDLLPGRWSSAQLWTVYEEQRKGRSWPSTSRKTLGVALRAAGAKPVRTRAWRGWEL